MIVRLAWPDKLLWPNGGQGNRYAVSNAKKKAKDAASWAAIEARQKYGRFEHDGGEIPVRLIVYAKKFGVLPDKDNCISAVKVQLDAIAHEVGVNDRHFSAPVVEFRDPRIGEMEVHLG